MRITKIEHSNTKRSNAVAEMALVDWLHAGCPNVQFIKTTISEKCNKVTISKEINKTIKCAIKRGRPPCAQFLNTLPQR